MIENCTFTGCYNLDGAGGAIHVNGTSAVQTLKNCVFGACEASRKYSYETTDNRACGGAISVQNANLDISGCLTAIWVPPVALCCFKAVTALFV